MVPKLFLFLLEPIQINRQPSPVAILSLLFCTCSHATWAYAAFWGEEESCSYRLMEHLFSCPKVSLCYQGGSTWTCASDFAGACLSWPRKVNHRRIGYQWRCYHQCSLPSSNMRPSLPWSAHHSFLFLLYPPPAFLCPAHCPLPMHNFLDLEAPGVWPLLLKACGSGLAGQNSEFWQHSGPIGLGHSLKKAL